MSFEEYKEQSRTYKVARNLDRFLAWSIDWGIFLFVIVVLIAYALSVSVFMPYLADFIESFFWSIYHTYWPFLGFSVVAVKQLIEISDHGLTPGKVCRRLRVLGEDGSEPSAKINFWRCIARPLDILSLGIVPLRNEQRRRLGDFIAHTRVVEIPRQDKSDQPVAPPRRRLRAYLLDGLLIGGPHLLLWPAFWFWGSPVPDAPKWEIFHTLVLITVAIPFWDLLMEVITRGETPGKVSCNIVVVCPNGASPHISQIIVRWIAQPFDLVSLGFQALFRRSPRKLPLSDRLSGTALVERPRTVDVVEVAEDRPEPPPALLENIAESSKNARSIYLLYNGLLAYTALTVAGTSDRRLVLNEPAQLPVLNVDVSLNGFFLIAPLLSIFMFIYLQLYLGKLKRLRDDLRSNYRPIQETQILYPWLLNFADDLRGGVVAWTQRFIVDVSLWWSLPLVLGFLSLWFLKKHDPVFCGFVGIMPLVAGIVVVGYWAHYERPWDGPLGFRAGQVVLLGMVVLFVAYLFSFFMSKALEGKRLVGAWPAVNLSHQTLVTPQDKNFGTLYWVSLREAQLQGADFTGSVLQHADLRDAKLQHSKLAGAYLEVANLTHADLSDADLFDAHLAEADLRYADLSRADFRKADLREAKLQEANLSEAKFQNTELAGAEFDEKTRNLGKADFQDAKLAGAKMDKVKWPKAELASRNLSGIHLNSAILVDAKLGGTDLRDAELRKVDLTGAADLTNANLTGVDLRGANLYNAKLTNANLTGVDLRGANLCNAELTNANLTGVDLRGANLYKAELKDATFTDAKLDETILTFNTETSGIDLDALRSQGAVIMDPNPIVLRSEPIHRLSEWAVDCVAEVKRFVHWKDRRDPGPGFPNEFEVRDDGKVILDRASGLTWQRSGSEEALEDDEASTYVAELNRNRFAGYSDWRLPTLEEAMSLLEPSRQRGESEDWFIHPDFGHSPYSMWTSDQVDDSKAWIIDIPGRNPPRPARFKESVGVRAVRSERP